MNTNNNYYLYRGEDAPKNKEALWLHHSLYKDLSSPIVLDIYSQGKWQSVNASDSAIKGIGVNTICEMTQAEYDALTEKDANTIYIIGTTEDIANGHEYVDLGLTDEEENKIMFSPYNIGASSLEEVGDYYAWGELEPKETYDWSNYKWCNGTQYTLTKYNENSRYGIVDNKFTLDLEDDAVNVLFGSLWKIPSNKELNILISTINNPDYLWEYTNINNKAGWRITYNINGNYIFLPVTGQKYSTNIIDSGFGFYTSCDKLFDYRNNFLEFGDIISSIKINHHTRSFGRVIRPVLTIPKDYNPEVTGYKLYKGSILIADSNLPNEIEQLLASI